MSIVKASATLEILIQLYLKIFNLKGALVPITLYFYIAFLQQ